MTRDDHRELPSARRMIEPATPATCHRPGRGFRATGLLVLAVALLSCDPTLVEKGPAADDAITPPEIRVGDSISRDLAFESGHVFGIRLSEGDYLEVVTTQRGLDVAVALEDPRGEPLLWVDSPNGEHGPERLLTIAGHSGLHTLRVDTHGATSGGYVVDVVAHRRPSRQDRHRATGSHHFALAEAARRRHDRASRLAALELYETARQSLLDAGEVLWAVETHERRGWIYLDLRQPAEAVREFREGLELLEARGDDGQGTLGGEREQTLPSPGALSRRLLFRQAQAHREARQWDDAAVIYQRLIAWAQTSGALETEATASHHLAFTAKLQGDYFRAAHHYHRARKLWQRLGRAADEAVTLGNLGELLTTLGQHRRALELLEEARDKAAEGLGRSLRAGIASSLGKVYRRLGQLDESWRAYGQALRLRGSSTPPWRLAPIRLGLAQTLADMARYPEARELFGSVELTFLERDDLFRAGITALSRGWLEDAAGRATAATQDFETALDRLRQAEDLAGEASALYGLARAAARRGDLERAVQNLEDSLELIESSRSAAVSPRLKASFLDRKYDYYAQLVDFWMRRHELEPESDALQRAWRVSEQARARSALDLLRDSRLERWLEDSPPEEPSHIELDLWRPAATDDTTLGAMPELLGAGEVAAMLPEETVLLAFTLGETRSFLWWLSSDRFEAHALPSRAEIVTRARRVSTLFENLSTTSSKKLEANLLELSRALLEPIAEQLNSQQLIVVPDGALHTIPFAALPHPGGRSGSGETMVDRHRISRVTSASLLAALRLRRLRRPIAPKEVAVFADPIFERFDMRLRGSQPPPRGSSTSPEEPTTPAGDGPEERPTRKTADPWRDHWWRRLEATRREAEAIEGLVPASDRWIVTGSGARREMLFEHPLAEYRILHFATHGLVDEDRPEDSGLVLSLFDEAGRPLEGLLRTHEIYHLRLNADLVTLSACRTALGTEFRGEGLVGLTQAFQFAGASAVVVSLWKVDDEATAFFMQHFYDRLLGGSRSPAEALGSAQKATRDHPSGLWRAPFFWAGFVLEGDPQGLD